MDKQILMKQDWDWALGKINELTKELQHWKANHAEMVARNALLRDRPDLPLERTNAHKEMARLQEENAELKHHKVAQLTAVKDAARPLCASWEQYSSSGDPAMLPAVKRGMEKLIAALDAYDAGEKEE